MSFQYWLLRYLPDALRGEAVNVGVVVGSPDSGTEWAMRRVHSFRRASSIGGDARVLEAPLRRLADNLHVLAGRPPSGAPSGLTGRATVEHPAALLERMRRQQENQLGISAPRPIDALDAESAASWLFEMLVVEPTPSAQRRSRGAAVRDLREALYERVSPRLVQSNVRIVSSSQRARAEFAIVRSEPEALTQVWSFENKQTQNLAERLQASNYALSWLRREGGLLVNPNRQKQVDLHVARDIEISVLFVPPSGREQGDVFEAAKDAWRDLGVAHYEVGDEGRIAERIEGTLQATVPTPTVKFELS